MMVVESRVSKESLLAGRLVVYADLAECFTYPTTPTMVSLVKGEMEEHLPFYQAVGIDLETRLHAIREWLKTCENDEEAWSTLRREYTRLFIIAKPKVPAPPYGSVYLEPQGLVWGNTTVEAVTLYAEAGLKVTEDFKDIPDHFAAELEFMWYLIREEIKARGGAGPNCLGEVDEAKAEKMVGLQSKFLKEHLGAWYKDFLERVISADKSVFYREIAILAREFLSREMSNDRK